MRQRTNPKLHQRQSGVKEMTSAASVSETDAAMTGKDVNSADRTLRRQLPQKW